MLWHHQGAVSPVTLLRRTVHRSHPCVACRLDARHELPRFTSALYRLWFLREPAQIARPSIVLLLGAGAFDLTALRVSKFHTPLTRG